MTIPPTQDHVSSPDNVRPSAWPSILAGIAFSCATCAMCYIYGIVHWKIMLNKDVPRNPELLRHVYPLLAQLFYLRIIFAVLAIVWAAWSFRGTPRWGSWVALVLAVFAAMTVFIVI